jgi:succinate dehydrogenase flavin-adding protein (antitoxin of CptAB toxin-antitoxin module)
MIKEAVSLKKYFWDTDFNKLDIEKNKKYILERILEMGDEKAVKWMLNNFSKGDLLKVVKTSRQLSPKSRNFWNLFLSK